LLLDGKAKGRISLNMPDYFAVNVLIHVKTGKKSGGMKFGEDIP
jgi:hypothetical protein